MRITELSRLEEKRRHLPLLLDADPSEEMVMGYLPQGRMFVLERAKFLPASGRPALETLGEIVVVGLEGGLCELKNLAIVPHARGNGCGRLLIEHAAAVCKERFSEMLVGTSEAGVPFYQRCGFTRSHVSPQFFTINYPQPIWENGKRCEDMHYLRRPLQPSPLLSVCALQTHSFW